MITTTKSYPDRPSVAPGPSWHDPGPVVPNSLFVEVGKQTERG
jgi:hypothetical protein